VRTASWREKIRESRRNAVPTAGNGSETVGNCSCRVVVRQRLSCIRLTVEFHGQSYDEPVDPHSRWWPLGRSTERLKIYLESESSGGDFDTRVVQSTKPPSTTLMLSAHLRCGRRLLKVQFHARGPTSWSIVIQTLLFASRPFGKKKMSDL